MTKLQIGTKNSLDRRQVAQFDLLDTIIDTIALQGPVLDVGAGTGLLARHLDIDVINLDLSSGMLSHAPYPRVVADWAALPIRNETIGTFFSIARSKQIETPSYSCARCGGF